MPRLSEKSVAAKVAAVYRLAANTKTRAGLPQLVGRFLAHGKRTPLNHSC